MAVTFNRLTIMFNRQALFWKKRTINSPKEESIRSVCYITSVIIALVSIFNLHFLYFYELDLSSNKENQFINDCTVKDKRSDYYKFRTKIYGKLHLYIFVIVPCITLFVMNLLIIKKVMPSIKRTSVVKMTICKNKKNKQRRSLSIMLIAVCLWFVILKTPASVYITLPIDEMKKSYYPFTYSLFMLINYANHAVNLIIYVLISSSFRKELKDFFLNIKKKFFPTAKPKKTFKEHNLSELESMKK